MENIEIPDDLYICDKYLCHKSCTYKNNSFSNNKFHYLPNKLVLNEIISKLRHKCNILDEIEEKTYFIDYKFNNLCYDVYAGAGIYLYGMYFSNLRIFTNVNDLLEYLDKNHPECVKSTDIKIALKD
jgi:hypothetical protein